MKLVLMGDFHYPRLDHADADSELFQARDVFFSGMIQAFLDIEADYHISLGDFSNFGAAEELSALYGLLRQDERQRRFIHVLGNHDTYSMPKPDILALTGQQRYHSIDTDEARLIFLDTSKEMDHKDYGGEIDPAQRAWLDKELLQAGSKPVLLFGHHPIPETTALSDLDMLRIHPEDDIWPSLKKTPAPGYYFCGHNHIHSIASREHWHFVQTAACLDLPAFRVAELKDGQLSVDTIPVQDEHLLQLAKLIKVNMKHFKPKPAAAGQPSDHSLRVNHT
ncbi:metallophosphoesterase family protein [Paenibacillus cremeus]|uniref:Metallophosphoesterase n=1 Tax=Paenibacillus cremeus TaxID=2163881 RepID=A0A559K724_9BACL|nr:metallophosphoesterase [Paenibacillus cremeus]TVY07931.1 metallophosphoesterase [Paenibacillus cremeus]